MKIRTAVVGCGALANGAHLPNLQKSNLFDLVVTCDQHADAAGAAAKRWGAERTSTDWHEVVDAADVDMIVLCTHTNLRGELICAALRNGKPVYTEKPLADSRAEMMEIFRTRCETGVPVCIGHNRRSSPAAIEFKRLFNLARENGADRSAIIDRNTGKRDQLAEERQTQLLLRVNDDIRTWKLWIFSDDSGIMLGEMVHFIDFALWLIPSDPVEVYAMGSTRGNFTQLIRFRDGSIATLQHSMVGNFDYPKELFEASHRNVTIALDHHLEVRQRGLDAEPLRSTFPLETGTELTDKTGINGFYEATERLQQIRKAGGELPVASVGPCKGHLIHLEQFGRHTRGEAENPCPLESAIVVTNVALRFLESVRLGMPVKIGPEDYDLIHHEPERHQ